MKAFDMHCDTLLGGNRNPLGSGQRSDAHFSG